MYLYWEFIGIVFFPQTKHISPCGLAEKENITVRFHREKPRRVCVQGLLKAR